jgi:hypothetical protein
MLDRPSDRFVLSLSITYPLDPSSESLSYSLARAVNRGKQIRVHLFHHNSARWENLRGDTAALIDTAPSTVHI